MGVKESVILAVIVPVAGEHVEHCAPKGPPDLGLIVRDPARRAQQTAVTLDRRFKTVAALAPDGSVDGLLHAVRWPESREPVLVVGHQPMLGLAAAYLLAGQPQAWAVRKSAVWWMRARQREGSCQVVLHAVMAPDLA
jgi:phosphohistidine phosphatase